MFGREKKDKGPMIEARATITNVQDTGMTINDNPRVKLTLRVEPEGGEPWEAVKKATVSRINIPRVGDPIRVKYFQNAPDGLAIQPRTDEDIAAAQAAQAGHAAPAPAAVADPLDELKKLNDLRAAGALTDDEFSAQKAKLLA
jgi:hypothetical protein